MIDGNLHCTCDEGWDQLSNCYQCADNYYGDDCVYCEASVTCNGNGTCNDQGTCECNEDYYLTPQGGCNPKSDVGEPCDMLGLTVGDICLDGLTCGQTPDYDLGMFPVCY